MFNTLRLVGMVAMLLVVVLAAALLQPEEARDLGLEQTLTTLGRELRGEPPMPTSPNREEMERVAAKHRVVVALLEGRLTLFEAAAHFRRLHSPRVDLRWSYRGDSEEELLCRQVITSAEIELHMWGKNAAIADFTARWEEELRRHLKEHGKVMLPDVADEPDAPAPTFPSR
jgi:hypothetical protein